MDADKPESGLLNVRRLEALTDGIFAISMTILVLTINVPQKAHLGKTSLHSVLIEQLPEFFNYILSFLLLATFWVVHHQQFHYIRHTDRRHVWLNISTLMFIALVPFSTSLAGDFSGYWMAELFFSCNMFIIGMFLYWSWSYATAGYRLVETSLDSSHILTTRRKIAALPAISLLAIILALIYPLISSYVYLLMPVILFMPKLGRGKKHSHT